MKLRDYQKKAVERVLECWRDFKSCLIVLPTGCGKTVVFAEIIRRVLSDSQVKIEGEGEERNGTDPSVRKEVDIYDIDDDDEEEEETPKKRAMILAHREELITQARDKVNAITGADVQIEMGAFEVKPMFGEMPQVVVSTVQTQCAGARGEGEGRRRRMDKFDPDDYNVLVIDEAHHATAKSYRNCIDHYFQNPDCRLVGVTATPDRADESALGQVFETVAFEYSVTDAIHDGWLVPVKQRLVKVNSLDFSKVTTCAGDFNQGELAQVLEEEHNLHAIAVPTMEICGDRRAIIFAASVRQAERICEIINRGMRDEGTGNRKEATGLKRAAWVCGKTDKVERRTILDDFKNGKIQFVVNVGVLTEGFDDAGVSVVVMARPTKSRALYAQMAGRATRPAAEIAAKLGEVEDEGEQWNSASCASLTSGEDAASPFTDAATLRREMIAASSKPSCLIIDFVGNSGRHKLVSTADILGGEIDDEDEEEARNRAKRRCAESSEETDMIAEVEKARAEIKAEKEAEAKRRSFIQATARFVEVSIDPFNIFDLPPIEKSTKCSLGTHLSWKQKELLREKLKIDPEKLSVESGRQLLDEYFRRVNAHLATFGQVKALRKFGIPVPMSFDEANRTLTRLFREA